MNDCYCYALWGREHIETWQDKTKTILRFKSLKLSRFGAQKRKLKVFPRS